MATPRLKTLDRAVQTTNAWLNEISHGLAVDRPTAWHALGAVLHTLRDRLNVDEARHLGAQLPLIIRGLFFDQWGPAHRLSRIKSGDQFIDRVQDRLKSDRVDPDEATAVVFGVLMRHPTGEIQKLMKTLPPSLRKLGQTNPKSSSQKTSSESPFAWE